jgi:glutathione S-transferase
MATRNFGFDKGWGLPGTTFLDLHPALSLAPVSRPALTGGIHPEITLPHTDEWELYHNSFSLCSKKLRVCMAELGIPYRSHHIHLIETGAYENVGRAYLTVNPAGLVPVLVHHGHPVYESHEEIVYAAGQAGERGLALLPRDPTVKTLVDHWIDCASLVGDAMKGSERRAGHCIPALTFPLFATMVRYIPYREIFRGLLTHPNKERPLFFATLKWRSVNRLPSLAPVMRIIRRARDHMGAHLDALARQLESHGGPWIAGDRLTLADVSWVVILDRLVEADWDAYFWGGGRRPTVAAYWERLIARPSYGREIVDVRCPNTGRGIDDLKAAKASNASLRAALEGR